MTSDWVCQFVLKGPVVMTASEVKQGSYVCYGCFKLNESVCAPVNARAAIVERQEGMGA